MSAPLHPVMWQGKRENRGGIDPVRVLRCMSDGREVFVAVLGEVSPVPVSRAGDLAQALRYAAALLEGDARAQSWRAGPAMLASVLLGLQGEHAETGGLLALDEAHFKAEAAPCG